MVKIEKADNGWIIHYDDHLTGEDGKEIPVVGHIVVEEEEKYTDEDVSLEHCKVIRNLLYAILEMLGERNSKHDKFHYDIVIKDKDYKELEGLSL